MPLTIFQIKNAKPQAKEYKLADGGWMYLLVKPNGAKYWRMKYRASHPDVCRIARVRVETATAR